MAKVPTGKASEPKDKKLTKADLEAAKKGHADFATLLNEGRKLSKAGDNAGAMAKFAEADKALPDQASLLGEYGWAAFKAGELELAELKTRRALAKVKKPKRKAAILYNLGRIEEARGNKAAALKHYEQSLSLRDNKTVAGRVAALGGEVPAPAPPADQAAADKQLDAMCVAAMNEWICSPAGPANEDDFSGECNCEAKVQRAPDAAAKSGGIKAVATLGLRGYPADGGSLDGTEHIAVQGPDGRWSHVGLMGMCHDPGVNYIKTNCEVEVELGDFLDAPGQELIVKSTNIEMDMNPGVGPYGENIMDEQRDWMLCRAVDQKVHCATVAVGGAFLTEAIDPTLFDADPLTPKEQAEADAQREASAWALDVALSRDGKVTISAPAQAEDIDAKMVANDVDAQSKALVGTHTLDAFEAHERVQLIKL